MRLFLYLLALVVGFSPAQAGGLALVEPVAVASAPQSAVATAQNEAEAAHAALIPAQSARPAMVAPAAMQVAPFASAISSKLTDRPLE